MGVMSLPCPHNSRLMLHFVPVIALNRSYLQKLLNKLDHDSVRDLGAMTSRFQKRRDTTSFEDGYPKDFGFQILLRNAFDFHYPKASS